MSKILIEVNKHDLTSWLIQSLRYCLGRKTYAVSVCVRDIICYLELFNESQIKQMIKDIEKHIELHEKNEMKCNLDGWKKLLTILERKVEEND